MFLRRPGPDKNQLRPYKQIRGHKGKKFWGPRNGSVVWKGTWFLQKYISSPHRLLTPWKGVRGRWGEKDQHRILSSVGPEYRSFALLFLGYPRWRIIFYRY